MTELGVLGIPAVGRVDESGTVVPQRACWQLHWWVGADDRWHFADREAAVRQALGDDGVSVETRMRVPGGDIVQHAYAAPFNGQGVMVLEFTNDTPVPVVLALALHPARSGAGVKELHFDDRMVDIGGRPALRAERAPARVAVGARTGCVEQVVVESRAEQRATATVTSEGGIAEGAFLWPLTHGSTLRVVVPLDGTDEASLPTPDRLPGRADVGRGWATHLDAATRVRFPEPSFDAAVERARRHLLIATQQEDAAWLDPDGSGVWRRAVLAIALDVWGHHRAARDLLLRAFDRDGHLPHEHEHAATAALLVAFSRHLRLAPDPALAAQLVEPAADAVGFLAKQVKGSWWRRRPADALPALGTAPRFLGEGAQAWDTAWIVGGLRGASEIMRAVGEVQSADDTRELADDVVRRVNEAVGAGDQAVGLGSVATLLGVFLGVVSPSWPLVEESIATTAAAAVDDVVQWEGLALPFVTGLLGIAEIRSRDPRGIDRLRALVRLGGPTGAIAGRHRGDDPMGSAAVLLLARQVLVEDRRTRLVVLPVVPDQWLGAEIEAFDLPSIGGPVSFGIRWHGERPALLWERGERATGKVIARGLDPAFASADRSGEALLAASTGLVRTEAVVSPVVDRPTGDGPGPGESFS